MNKEVYLVELPEHQIQDLLLELTEEEIEFSHTYMDGMREFQVGDTTRDKKELARELSDLRASSIFYKDAVQTYMKHILVRRVRRLHVSGQRVIDELAKIAFSNVRDILEVDPQTNLVQVKSLHEIEYPEIIKEFKSKKVGAPGKVGYGVIYEVKLYDKMEALDRLCKLLGLYEEEAGLKHVPNQDEKTTVIVNKININHRRPGEKLIISMKKAKHYAVVALLLIGYVIACNGQETEIIYKDGTFEWTMPEGSTDWGISSKDGRSIIYPGQHVITAEMGGGYQVVFAEGSRGIFDYLEDPGEILPPPTMKVFLGGGLGSIQQAQAQLITRDRNVVDVGASVSAGLFMDISRQVDEVQFFAKGVASRVYDTEYALTIDNYYFSAGLLYKPNYLGIGIGLGSLIRPNIQTADVGANIVGVLDYPLTKRISGIIMFDYVPPIVERTSYNAIFGIGYTL